MVNNIYRDLIRDTNYTPDSKSAICGDIHNNQNLTWASGYPFIYQDGEVYSKGPSSFMLNQMPGSELPAYYTRFEGVFKQNGYQVNIIGATDCDKNNDVYPEKGYIVEQANDIYKVYLGVYENPYQTT